MLAPVLLNARNPGPMTGGGNNTYLIAGAGRAALVDAGVGDPQHLDAIDAALRTADARLDRVLVTHGHADHADGAASIVSRHPAASCWKKPWPGQDAQYGVEWQRLNDGDVVTAGETSLTVLHTPGHSPDHLAFWHEPSGTMFTGDLVVLGTSVMIHTSKGGDLRQYMQSLERLRALAPSVLLPAHGPRVENPEALLSGYLAHRRQREQQVLDALGSGHVTVETIAESIYHGLEPALMAAAHENVRAHLAKLKDDGVAVEDGEGRWRR